MHAPPPRHACPCHSCPCHSCPLAMHAPPLWKEWQMLVKTLPFRNYSNWPTKCQIFRHCQCRQLRKTQLTQLSLFLSQLSTAPWSFEDQWKRRCWCNNNKTVNISGKKKFHDMHVSLVYWNSNCWRNIKSRLEDEKNENDGKTSISEIDIKSGDH